MRGLALVLVLVCCFTGTARAQAVVAAIPQIGGWVMVGGPPGQTDLSAAQAVLVYQNNSYVQTNTPVGGCTGGWAYFLPGAKLRIAPAYLPPEKSCDLAAGWNLVGDPFPNAAYLPKGTTGYYWDQTQHQYVTTDTIPLAASVWVYVSTAMPITLTIAPPASPVVTLTSPTPPATAPTIRVGDRIALRLGGSSSSTSAALADGRHLVLDNYGLIGRSQVWVWLATSPGTATINVIPACRLSNPACMLAFPPIQVTVLP